MRISDWSSGVCSSDLVALAKEGASWLVHDVHHGKHPSIEFIDEQTATGEWTLWFMQVNNKDKTVMQMSMEYRDTYVIEDGRWKIAKSHVTPMTTEIGRAHV